MRLISPLRWQQNYSIISLVYFFLFIALFSQIQADEKTQPMVKVQLQESTGYWVGEKISFYVELYSPTWFSGTSRFEIPKVKGAVVYKLPGSPVLGSEEIDGDSYSVLRHEFIIFTTKSGTISVPPFTVDFRVAVPGKKARDVSLKTQLFKISTVMPEQCAGKEFITTTYYQISESWDKDISEVKFKVGDTLTRTINRTTENSLAMLIPPFSSEKITGVGIYPATPKLTNREERGDFTGQRIEKITYILEREGELVFPEVVFFSWNPKNEELKLYTLDKLVVKVAPNPIYQKKKNTVQPPTQIPNNFWLLFSSIVLIVFIFGFWCRIFNYKWKHSNSGIEKKSFKEAIKLLQQSDEKSCYQALVQWCNCLQGNDQINSLTNFIDIYGSPQLKKNYQYLSAIIFGHSQERFNTKVFVNELIKSRKKFFQDKKTHICNHSNPFVLRTTKNIYDIK